MVSSCGDSKKAEIEKSFNKTLSMYPTKNLEDFYYKKPTVMKSLIKMIKGHGLLDLK